MATYFCSDPHAFHGNIMKYTHRTQFMTAPDRDAFLAEEEARGGRYLKMSDESVDTMNRALIANINARVEPGDTLWCLGDWSLGLGADYMKNARWFRDQVACRDVRLIKGNHDRNLRGLFTQVFTRTYVEVEGARVALQHRPLGPDCDRPGLTLHGHIHSRPVGQARIGFTRTGEPWCSLDVGFDGHDYQVWSFDEIRARFKLEAS